MTQEAPDARPEKPRSLELIEATKRRAPDLIVLLVIGGAITYVALSDGAIPRWAQVIGFAAIATTPLGYLTGQKVISWLYNPTWVYLVDLDARVLDGGIYRLPPDEFRELDVLDDEEFVNPSYELTQLSPSLYVGKQVDLDDMTVVGTWRGTLDDRELARALRAVHECRGQLQRDAQRGFILESSAFVVVRRATRNTVRRLVDVFEDGTLPDRGDAIDDAIDAELEDFGLDQQDGDIDDLVDDADLDDLDHKSGFDFSEPEPEESRRNGHAEPAEVSADD